MSKSIKFSSEVRERAARMVLTSANMAIRGESYETIVDSTKAH